MAAATPPTSLTSSLRRSHVTPAPRCPPRAALRAWSVFDPALLALTGTHRIQRVPVNDKRGRRHSSVVTVVEVPDGPAGPVRLDRSRVRVDTFRASGPGGQHRNKTDSGVRLTHLDAGVVVTATEDRSQHVNRAVAWARLEQALQEAATREHAAAAGCAKAAGFGGSRSFTWTAWRDEVSGPTGRARMSSALRGSLSPLLPPSRRPGARG